MVANIKTGLRENNIIIITRKERIKRFIKVYKNTITFIVTPFIWLPIAYFGKKDVYISSYVFMVNATYLVVNIFHPGITSLIPIAMFTVLSSLGHPIIGSIFIGNSVIECFGVLMIIIAIENSNLHKRVAIRILLIFGCSHFRLSFLMFFSTMVISMGITTTMACGLMMPLVKAMLNELENMGVLETYETQKAASNNNDELRPTDFTTFYFLGIAYSSTIGGISTLFGNETNQLFKNYCETFFPKSPILEAPHIMLLTLPGTIIMELCLYLWLNFYFLGMLRVQNYTSMQTSLTNEEEQFIAMLLVTQNRKLGTIKFHEIIVGSTVILTVILQATINYTNLSVEHDTFKMNSLNETYAPSIICAVVFFVTPVNLDFIKFFKHNDGLARSKSFQTCLTWSMVKKNMHWSVLLINASCNLTFEAMKYTKMDEEFEKFLFLFSALPTPALALIVIVFCKILTEFANNFTVAKCLLVHIANLSIASKLNPRFLMVSASLATSLPFHLLPGAPAYAMVAAYVGIPPSKMIMAGIGPSVIAILTSLFTVSVWSKIIWPDINGYPEWANVIE